MSRITDAIITQAFAEAKGGRASKRGLFPIELVGAGGFLLADLIKSTVKDIFLQFSMPPQLGDPDLQFLHKGHPRPRDIVKKNYRPLGILEAVGNTFGGIVHILFQRDVSAFIDDCHFGGREKCDCLMAVFCVLMIEERALLCGLVCASLHYDIEIFFCSILYDFVHLA